MLDLKDPSKLIWQTNEPILEPELDWEKKGDGAKCDTGNIQDIFGNNITIAVPDPVYPVYVDTNVMAGRTGACKDGRYEGFVYLESTKANGFVPSIPDRPVDLIYLCFPNNSTGSIPKQIREINDYYLRNAALIRSTMEGLGYTCAGGKNGPYIWIETGTDSWAFFDTLLDKAQVVCTPGAGFGKCGEGYIRISAFNNYENVQKALVRITGVLSAKPI